MLGVNTPRHGSPGRVLLWVLILATVAVRLPGVFSRSIWYDESVTLLETAGNAIPSWPDTPTLAYVAKRQLVGDPSLRAVADDLRSTDVHPPLYFCLLTVWRGWLGPSIEGARLLSLLLSTGAVVLLYLLLEAAGWPRPFFPSLVFSVTSGAVFYGHEARPYALALFLIMSAALLALKAEAAGPDPRHRSLVCSLAMALCCGLAFQTNFLSLFPVAAVLGWYTIRVWSHSKGLILAAHAAALAVALIGFSKLLLQVGARPLQMRGFRGVLAETSKIIDMNFFAFWTPVASIPGLTPVMVGTVVVLLLANAAYLREQWSRVNRAVLLLFVGLALAPSVGLFLLDLVSDRNLHKPQYLVLAGPGIAVLLTLGAAGFEPPGGPGRRSFLNAAARLPAYLVPFMLGLQLTGVNMGLEKTPGFGGNTLRSLAQRISGSPAQSQIVVIGAGNGRGDPGSIVYELEDDPLIMVCDLDTDLEALRAQVEAYDEVWIVFSHDRQTAEVEHGLLRSLTGDGRYAEVFRRPLGVQLRRTGFAQADPQVQ